MFMDLHAARVWLDGTPQPLTYTEIAAYNVLTGAKISADDVMLINGMDRAFLKSFTEETRINRERQKAERKRKG